MITTKLLRTLTLSQDASPHLSAASGMVAVGDFLYVVADDENYLGVFNRADTRAGHLHRIFDGEDRKSVV